MVFATSEGRARNGYWPMPFAKSCRITLTNEGRRRLDHVYYHVDWSKVPALPPDTLYFHARYKQELPAEAEKKVYTFLDVKGRGFYAGTVLSVVQPEAGWFGEGDERIYVDGEKEPSIIGTGSEDYFNDAWGLHVVDGPYYGVTVADGTGLGSRMTGYRWHIKDPIPFKKSFRFDMEHLGWTFNNDGSLKSPFGTRDDLYSSVAFWYQEGVATGLWPVPYGSARLPQGNAIQFEVEKVIAQAKAEKGQASVFPDLFWSKDVLIFKADGPGSRIEIPVRGRGSRRLRALHADRDGLRLRDLQRAPRRQAPGRAGPRARAGRGRAARALLRRLRLRDLRRPGLPGRLAAPDEGTHTLTYVCLGKNAASTGYVLGVDNIVLARGGSEGLGEGGKREAAGGPDGFAGATRALSDQDLVVRGLAARELRRWGPPRLPPRTRSPLA